MGIEGMKTDLKMEASFLGNPQEPSHSTRQWYIYPAHGGKRSWVTFHFLSCNLSSSIQKPKLDTEGSKISNSTLFNIYVMDNKNIQIIQQHHLKTKNCQSKII